MAERDGRAIWHPLASVKETSLLGWVSIDSVCTSLSNMYRCCTFPFALAGLFFFLTHDATVIYCCCTFSILTVCVIHQEVYPTCFKDINNWKTF